MGATANRDNDDTNLESDSSTTRSQDNGATNDRTLMLDSKKENKHIASQQRPWNSTNNELSIDNSATESTGFSTNIQEKKESSGLRNTSNALLTQEQQRNLHERDEGSDSEIERTELHVGGHPQVGDGDDDDDKNPPTVVAAATAMTPQKSEPVEHKTSTTPPANTSWSKSKADNEICPGIPSIASFSEGLRRKASMSDPEAWIKLSLTLDGRDKITKVLQYVARFLSWSLLGLLDRQAKRLGSLKSSLSEGRKAFRLGRTLIELHRLRTIGFLEEIGFHWKRTALNANCDDDEYNHQSFFVASREKRTVGKKHERNFVRQISSNIGLDYQSTLEMAKRLFRQQSFVIHQIHRLSSRVYSMSFLHDDDDDMVIPLWQTCLAAVKLLATSCYYVGDNLSFLSGSGVLDNFAVADEERIVRRKNITTRASKLANRADFVSGVAGLVVCWKCYRDFCNTEIGKEDCENDNTKTALEKERKRKEKQVTLFLSVAKSCCDVLMFSNNPGVDLWKNSLGFHLNEGVYCVAGLISAMSVLCSKFPMRED